jgi:hypothetical protein
MAPNDGIGIVTAGTAYRISIIGNTMTLWPFCGDNSTIGPSTNTYPRYQQGYYTNIASSSYGDYSEEQARLKAARLRWQRFIHELMTEPRESWRPLRACRRLAIWTTPPSGASPASAPPARAHSPPSYGRCGKASNDGRSTPTGWSGPSSNP